MSLINFKFLIILVSLAEMCQLSTCATLNTFKLNRLIRETSSQMDKKLNQSTKKVNNMDSEQNSETTTLASYYAHGWLEENTKKVIFWTPETYPNPFIDFKNCSRQEAGYICDPDEILEEEESK